MQPVSSHAVLRYIRKLAGAAGGDSTDGQLLDRFLKDRDEAAFASLVERHGPMVLNVCRRRLLDANEVDDAFQAVFLVLVKKARSIRAPSLLGNWLYGVACRAAANARRQAARRHSRTKEIVDMPATEPTTEAGWQELRPLLDEELQCLPEKYRAPLVLCYLQGKTYTEAARILGWADGTVSGRLARGREMLRQRLIKRGVTLSMATLTALLVHHAAEATTVPAALAATTIKAALLIAAGKSLAAGVSTGAAALTEGVLKAMFLTKLKIATAVVLTLSVVGMGGGMFSYDTWAWEKDEQKKDAANPKETASKDKGGTPAVAAGAPAPAKEGNPAAPPQPIMLRGRQLRELLAKTVNFEGTDDEKEKLSEVLDELAMSYNIMFDVNERAFEEEGLNDVLQCLMVAGNKPLPRLKGVRLSTVLKKILSRLPATVNPTFVVRSDRIEITTETALRRELGLLPANAVPTNALFPLVTASFDKVPLADALKEISNSTDFNVIFDAAKLEGKQAAVTARLDNVPVDTAVRILAEMAGMRAVLLDNVLFVTSAEAAERLQQEEGKRKPTEVEVRPPAPGGAGMG